MKRTLTAIGAAAAAMLAEKTEEQKAIEARAARAPKIAETRASFTPEMLRAIAADEAPECLELTREAFVAMAQIALQAVQLVDEIASRIEIEPAAPGTTTH